MQAIGPGTAESPSGPIQLDWRLAYDLAGNLIQRDTRDGPTSYAYDPLDRLIEVVPPASVPELPLEGYQYDGVGNRTQSAHQPGVWGYDPDNRLTQYGDSPTLTALTHSPNGQRAELITPTHRTRYHYDAADRLTSLDRDGQEQASYRYDPFGRRIAKTLQGFTTWYLYTDEGLIAELDATGTLTRAYGWEPDSAYGTKPLWQAEIQGASWHFHFLHPDHLGTPQLATDAQGNISWQARSEAFGRTFPAPTNAITMNLRFPGQYYDQESGLHYNYYRDYDPEVGRYVEGDPIGLAGGVNTSVYSVNNPQRFSDARGLEIVGEYFIYPRITIKKIQYRDWIDWGDPSWDPMSAWRIGWYHVRGEGVIDFIVHCIEYDECKNIKHEWFVDKAFDVAVEKTFEIRQNLAGAVTYAYKITEMKLEIEKMLKSKIAEYALDPTTWCIFSRIILAITK